MASLNWRWVHHSDASGVQSRIGNRSKGKQHLTRMENLIIFYEGVCNSIEGVVACVAADLSCSVHIK
jgi:hypothetical protein